jgi:hypothetical protein
VTDAQYDVVADDRRRDRRVLLVILVVLVLLVGGLYAAGYALTSDRLPRGSRVGDVRVGGLSPAAARQEVARETAVLAARPVEVVADERVFRVRPAEVGLEVDVAGSVGQVPVGRSLDPREMWEALVGSTDVPLVVVAVGDGLERRVAAIADQVDEPVLEGGVEFADGRARAVYPQAGRLLDRPAAEAAVLAAYPSTGETVELALRDVPPTVSGTEVSRAMRAFANRAVSGPLTYRFGRLVVVVRPDDYAPALRMTAVDGRLRPEVDPDRLWALFDPVERVLGAGDRELRVADRVLPPDKAVAFLREEVLAGFLDVVRRPAGQRVVTIPVAPLRRR